MGLGSLRGEMWAGVMDDHIATDDKSVDEFKARLVAESLEDGVTISDVARRHGVPPQRLYAWRNQMRSLKRSKLTREHFVNFAESPVNMVGGEGFEPPTSSV